MRLPSPRPVSSRLAAALVLVLLLPPAAALAKPAGPADLLRSTAAAIADPQAKAIQEALDAAAAAEAEAKTLDGQLEALRSEAADAPRRTKEYSDQLALAERESLRQWTARLPANAGVDTLEALLEQERAAADQLRAQINSVTNDLAGSLAQPGSAGARQAELQRRIDELTAPVVAGRDEPAAMTEARRLRNDAERRRASAELALLQGQQDLAGTRQRLQELQLRALRHRLAHHQPRITLLQQRIADLGREELEQLAAALDQRARALSGADPIVVRAAADNRDLGRELVQNNERLASQRRLLGEEEAALARDLAGLRDSKARLELGGQSEQVGAWLWAELRKLEPAKQPAERLELTQATLAELRMRLISGSEQQRELGDMSDAVQALRESAPGSDDDTATVATDAGSTLEALLEERFDLLARLEPLIWRRIAALEQTERSLMARIAANQELRQLLDRHLLWIRSHPPVSAEWLAQLPAGLYDLVKPARFVTTAGLVRKAFAESPWPYLGSALVLVLLMLLQRRAAPRLERLALAIKDARQDRYKRTLECLAWTVVGALPWAVALHLAGSLLQDVGEAGKFSDSLGRALTMVAPQLFTFNFLGWLVRERGLAHAHFRWTRQRREVIRRWARWLAAVFVPLTLGVSLSFIRDQDLAITVAARIALVLMSGLGAFILWHVLGVARVWHTRGLDTEPSRMRRALRVALPTGMAGAAIAALGGYVYTSAILLVACLSSVGVLTAVAVLHGLLARWFVLGERRLALHRLDQRRAAEAEAQAEGASDDGGEALPVEVEQEITLERVNAQSRSMLRAVKLTLLVLGLAAVWAEILPAFARFDDIELWSITETAADGVKSLVPVTLMSALLGLVALALMVVAARNLPGLIEIGLLSRVGVDAASRYAITSVSRYVIVLTGVVIGFGLLGLRWGQLQWMAAALTVGLGFGLQEIFANFVSGLILLFERPFRVGDVITVNNLDGTVTRIRTRATTILDFDNKEIVVPNKSFITGQLVNWTLSDEVTRITLKVGVDYGTDPALVHRLLIQAAEENARVLTDRPPRSWLLEFGASTLDFELRVFVRGITDRLAVRNEINTRLIQLFAENGIEFAYPQMDIHVRDLPAAVERGDGGPGGDEPDGAAPPAAAAKTGRKKSGRAPAAQAATARTRPARAEPGQTGDDDAQ